MRIWVILAIIDALAYANAKDPVISAPPKKNDDYKAFQEMRKDISKILLNVEVATTGLIGLLETQFQESIFKAKRDQKVLLDCTNDITNNIRRSMKLNIYDSNLYKAHRQLLKMLLGLNTKRKLASHHNDAFHTKTKNIIDAIDDYKLSMAGVGLKYYYKLHKCNNSTSNK